MTLVPSAPGDEQGATTGNSAEVPAIEGAASLLAMERLAKDEHTVAVYWAPHPTDVLLIQVATDHRSLDPGERFLPLRFKAEPPDLPYPAELLLLSEEDWTAVQSGTRALPDTMPAAAAWKAKGYRVAQPKRESEPFEFWVVERDRTFSMDVVPSWTYSALNATKMSEVQARYRAAQTNRDGGQARPMKVTGAYTVQVVEPCI